MFLIQRGEIASDPIIIKSGSGFSALLFKDWRQIAHGGGEFGYLSGRTSESRTTTLSLYGATGPATRKPPNPPPGAVGRELWVGQDDNGRRWPTQRSRPFFADNPLAFKCGMN